MYTSIYLCVHSYSHTVIHRYVHSIARLPLWHMQRVFLIFFVAGYPYPIRILLANVANWKAWPV